MRADARRNQDRSKDFQPRRSATKAGWADEPKSHPDRCSKHSIVEPPENYPGTENKAEIIRGESY